MSSVTPKLNSPFATESAEVDGAYEIPINSVGIVPCDKRLSVTVGTFEVFETVPEVRSTGPILKINYISGS